MICLKHALRQGCKYNVFESPVNYDMSQTLAPGTSKGGKFESPVNYDMSQTKDKSISLILIV